MAFEPNLKSEDGQMMVLAAVVMLAGFLALGAMTARVASLEAAVGGAAADGFDHDFAVVHDGMEHATKLLAQEKASEGLLAEQANEAFAHFAQSDRGNWVQAIATCLGGETIELRLQMQSISTYAQATWIVAVPGRCL